MATITDPRRIRLLEWTLEKTVDEHNPKTQIELAAELGVDPRTLRDWAKESEFVERLREMTIELVGAPERVRQVVDAMFDQAIDPQSGKQVQAARVFADILGLTKKKEDRVQDPKQRLLSMPKDEFDALVAEVVAEASGAAQTATEGV